MQTAASYLQT
uniref:Uncharacterized protein n=1 Tax=Arundo donax TaxID=35708 RepID=A0A0A9GJS0_ARUDO